MYRNEMVRHVRQKVIRGELSAGDVAVMSLEELGQLFERGSVSMADSECIKRHAVSADGVRRSMQPIADVSNQLEGGSRAWFRENYPDAVYGVDGQVVTINLAGVEEEV
ncbi:hypothetical protein STSP2_00252 [Anaerohalosphaera lusitana]|uniref:Uncharacterized protein n=1 Tax=Anaerohalosphaera lusitana TaxID=1936003 RepID=A0A1U9NGP5_9BACT|nr:hypothetical protein [Anaerohalosphaera lusitana]AQT67111.1 hypothetical protein STSP2_00252 [Anaerohalosphaera lusitana]